MDKLHDKRFPGESDVYRAARNALLKEEMALRRQIESVAEFRRKLPLGGKVKEDYVFVEEGGALESPGSARQTRLSELFEAGKDTLLIYSFMFAPDADQPCPMCNALLDGLNGNAVHIRQRVNLAVVAKAPIEKINNWARRQDWQHLRFLSSEKNHYNRDYFAEQAGVGQLPSINVFVRDKDHIHHFYNSELLYVASEQGQHPRHADMIWPLWNVFDLTPQGRGETWMPRIDY